MKVFIKQFFDEIFSLMCRYLGLLGEYGEYGSYSAECLINEWRKTVIEDAPRCAACSSFQGDLGFSTNDTVSYFNYISSQVSGFGIISFCFFLFEVCICVCF